ncbi:glycosyltransferase family 2 protein [Segatella copri]|uniref:Glycosyltransferase family 2 protein n=1 Tax=Segatella copri TaxID=165179 RepID=A0A6G1VKI6_9BACT|nr:glycosyltransferase family 2 protein [Segatella copri]MQN58769.1 glycosyltransferase family 2 protein [Segatella copri]MQP13910.1 glycosyltransferase family 2 protein [Segatella copri]
MELSILIPHKNSSSLLKRLLDSVDGLNSQIIVVDDNSTDDEMLKVSELQQKYSFELYKNEGKYAGGARNTALKHAIGNWILFADCDDFYLPSLVALFNKYKDCDADIIYFSVESRYSDTLEPAYRDGHIKNISRRYLQSKNDWILRCCYTVPWGKMYKSSFVKKLNIQFDEVISGNDILFSIKSGVYAGKVLFEKQPIYCVTVSQNSITRIKDVAHFESRLQAYFRANEFLRSRGKNKFEISVMGMLLASMDFGFLYTLHVFKECLKHRSNLFVGMFDIDRYINLFRYKNH